MKKVLAVLVASVAMFFAACASSNTTSTGGTAVESNLAKLRMVAEEYAAKGVIVAVGEGVAVKEQNAMNQAQMYARAEIASILGVKSQQLTKAWNEEVGNTEQFESNSHQEQVNKEIISERVAGATTVKMLTEKQADGRYKVAVMMAMDPKVFEAFANALKSSEAVNEQIRARADAAYTSADEDFAAYDAMKNSANGI